MGKPVSYEDWLLTAGRKDELGLEILITYSMLRQAHKEKTADSYLRVVRDSFAKALFEKGYEPHTIEFITELDPEIRAKKIAALMETSQGMSLEKFAPVVYGQAVTFYNQVLAWESKSLWQYIKWWIIRKFKK